MFYLYLRKTKYTTGNVIAIGMRLTLNYIPVSE